MRARRLLKYFGVKIVPTRASALGLCFLLLHTGGEEETQAQRARARRDKRKNSLKVVMRARTTPLLGWRSLTT